MKSNSALIAALLPIASASLAARQTTSQPSNEDATDRYQEVCEPAIEDLDGTVPPCIQIGVIEERCNTNSTDSLDLELHAQCMCGGSYFSDWLGCQNCLLVHGFRSERDNVFWESVMSEASNALCTGTPTAAFQELFASVTNVPAVTTGETRTTDQFPGQTDVSNYYTATVSQGPGSYFGSALESAVNRTSMESFTQTTSSTTSTTSTTTDEDEAEDNAVSTTATTTNEDNAAAPTRGPLAVGALVAAALLAAI
jgi:hypothetical protein